METKNIMIVGVGGQGSLLASKLLGRLLADEGFDDLERLKNNLAVLQDMVKSTIKKYPLIRRKTHSTVVESNWKQVEKDLKEIYGK